MSSWGNDMRVCVVWSMPKNKQWLTSSVRRFRSMNPAIPDSVTGYLAVVAQP